MAMMLGEKSAFVETAQGGMITNSPSDMEGCRIIVGRGDQDGKTVISILRGLSKGAQ